MGEIAYKTISHPVYKYQLTQDLVINVQDYFKRKLPPHPPVKIGEWVSFVNHVLTLAAGYCWDGNSGPAVDTMNSARGSGGHDGLYQLIAEGLLLRSTWKKIADQLYWRLCKEDGMGWWARVRYRAVRMFGGAKDRYIHPEDLDQ